MNLGPGADDRVSPDLQLLGARRPARVLSKMDVVLDQRARAHADTGSEARPLFGCARSLTCRGHLHASAESPDYTPLVGNKPPVLMLHVDGIEVSHAAVRRLRIRRPPRHVPTPSPFC